MSGEPHGVLFLCVANSARSQMAEALARSLLPESFAVYSAGSNPSVLNPVAVQVLAELGIDVAGQHAKGLFDIPLAEIRTVITLCDEEVCPAALGDAERIVRLHWAMPDPAAVADETERLAAFRAVRDRIAERIEVWMASDS